MGDRDERIRNPALSAAVVDALAGRVDPLYAVLARLSGLPGVRPNLALAETLGRHLSDLGSTAHRVVLALLVPVGAAATMPAAAFFPMCGAMTLAHQYIGGRAEALAMLREASDDTRREVRGAIVAALLIIGRHEATSPESRPLIDALGDWMSDFMPAAVAFEAIAQRAFLDMIHKPEPILARLEQAIDLVAHAARADERTQGYRLLLRALSEAAGAILGRFPDRGAQWFDERLEKGGDAAIRRCIEQVLEDVPTSGASGRAMHALRQRISETARPPRDPRTVVGPTRRRGSRR